MMSLLNESSMSDDQLLTPSPRTNGFDALGGNAIDAILEDPSSSNLRFRGTTGGGVETKGKTDFVLRKDATTNEDEALEHPEDDDHTFFAKGRDFESVNVNHKYTKEERKILAGFESLDYLPSHSKVFQQWLKRQPFRLDWDRWIMMGIIGFLVGMVGFLNGQLIHLITETKWEHGIDYISKGSWALGWTWITGYSILFTFVSTFIIVCLHPHAGGSGIPEVIGFLNGTIIHSIFSIRTLIAKFCSSVTAVGSGLPVGPEGPMIHMGALVGAGVSQARSESLKFELPFFGRFRNSEDRRNFISAGAGAGVASAFGAPVGGLLFAMEEVSSFWNMKLSWQTFFACMTATFTTDLFNSAFTGFTYTGGFGLFKKEKYILFTIGNSGLEFHILVFLPTILLGVFGGLLGAAFTFLNLKMARVRRRLTSKLKQRKVTQRIVRMAEPIIIMFIVATISIFLPMALKDCLSYKCGEPSPSGEQRCTPNTSSAYPKAESTTVESPHETRRYTCTKYQNATREGAFSPGATLFMTNGHEAVKHLFTRKTHLEFGYKELCGMLFIYFPMACWAAGPSIAGGLVVPMLLIGGLYGRILGRAMVDIFGIYLPVSAGGTEAEALWAWMDPGAFALIGAASFFGGVSRLTMSLTVIMIEITNDVMFLLPIMVAVMVAKVVADKVTHSLYHAQLEVKCVPFLDAEPVIVHEEGDKVTNLELHSVEEVMSSPAVTVEVVESVAGMAQLLVDHQHGGFPVVKRSPDTGKMIFFGLITRLELTMVLMAEEAFKSEKVWNETEDDVAPLGYQQVAVDKITDIAACQQKLSRYIGEEKYQNCYVNLSPYFNRSAMALRKDFSLHRAYIIFRSLGLRHLTITDRDNGVLGILTRKDLMGFNLEEKIAEWRTKAARGSAEGVGGAEGGSGTDESPSRVEFTRTHTAVVDIH